VKPLLALDVDGVLNTVVPNSGTGQEFYAEGFRICVPRGTAERLERLGEAFEIAWCTTWEGMANEHIAPMVGLPELPVIEWQRSGRFSPTRGMREHSKLTAIVDYADGRDWAFVDDDADWERGVLESTGWVLDDQVGGRYAIVEPELYEGLTDEHVEVLLYFAEGAKT